MHRARARRRPAGSTSAREDAGISPCRRRGRRRARPGRGRRPASSAARTAAARADPSSRSNIARVPWPPVVKRLVLNVLLLAAVLPAAAAHAGGPGLVVGATEDVVRQATPAASKVQMDLLRAAGFTAVRVSQVW